MRGGKWFNPHAPHGSANGYVNYLCRCRECTDAWAAHGRELKERRFARRELVDGRLISPGIKHGGAMAHRNHGCECTPCLTAHQEATK